MRLAPLGWTLALALLVAAPVRAAELRKDMDALVAEGTKWFQEAGNTDLGTAERNAARVKAWKCLWPAKEALDQHEEENPAGADALQRKYPDLRMMVHWLKKESPVGLLEGSGVGPAKGGDVMDPEPATPVPPPAPPTTPSTPSAPSPPPPPPAPAPPVRAVATPESLFAAAEEYERRHRTDLPGIHERYFRVVASFPDLSKEIVRRATEKAGELEGKLKDGYRLLRNEDPDELKDVNQVRIKGMVVQVARDLASPEAPLRERAARTLGLLASPEAIYALDKALRKEKEDAPRAAMVAAFVGIGGGKGADALAELKGDAVLAPLALDGLLRLAGRNRVDRRLAAKRIGHFAYAKDEALFRRALAALQGMGLDGAIGMQEGLDHSRNHARLVSLVNALADMKEPAVARVLARYFQQSKVPADDSVREAALAAVRKMAKKENLGEAVIPHLFIGVRTPETRFHTTNLLQELTGQDFSVKQWAQWSAWWRSNHPGWSEDGKGK